MSGVEIVDEDGERVAYLPSRSHWPHDTRHRAEVLASSLNFDAHRAETVSIVQRADRFEVWDGRMKLADFAHGDAPDAALRRAEDFQSGYLVARRLALGEKR